MKCKKARVEKHCRERPRVEHLFQNGSIWAICMKCGKNLMYRMVEGKWKIVEAGQ
jgi:hypothetical protein